ncbi:MAG: hypothetical protein KAX19_13650, partial [Candidatus Brocadiae bacterium]|nr:hypothetical protein [Candidatus Brocadiia bacterium]
MEDYLSAATSFCIIAALVFAPLAFGGVEPWAYSVLAVLAYTALAAALVRAIAVRDLRPMVTPILIPAVLALLLVGLQYVRWPASLLGVLSPRAVEVHQAAAIPGAGASGAGASAGVAEAAVRPSLYAHATRDAFIRLSTYVALFLATCACVRKREHVSKIAAAVVSVGFAVALFGIVANLS